jgi:alanyl-tRNA synthetase
MSAAEKLLHAAGQDGTVEGVKVVYGLVDVDSDDELKQVADYLKDKLGSGVIVLGSKIGEKAMFVSSVSQDAISEKKLHAGKIVNEVARKVGGGGGGRPNFATAGGKDQSKIRDAVDSVPEIVKQLLK